MKPYRLLCGAVALALPALLGGCPAAPPSGNGSPDPLLGAQQVIGACDGYAAMLQALTPLRANGQLPPRLVDAVNAANAETDPICRDPDLAGNLTADKLLPIVQRQITNLTAILAAPRSDR